VSYKSGNGKTHIIHIFVSWQHRPVRSVRVRVISCCLRWLVSLIGVCSPRGDIEKLGGQVQADTERVADVRVSAAVHAQKSSMSVVD